MPCADAADAGRSGQKESAVALVSLFLAWRPKIGNEVATQSWQGFLRLVLAGRAACCGDVRVECVGT